MCLKFKAEHAEDNTLWIFVAWESPLVLVMVCAKKNTYYVYNMMHSPIISIHWCCTGLCCMQLSCIYMFVFRAKGICILLKLSQFPSLKSVCVVSLQTVLCKLHTYICNIQPTDLRSTTSTWYKVHNYTLSQMLTWAPFSSSSLTTVTWPSCEAKWSAVIPLCIITIDKQITSNNLSVPIWYTFSRQIFSHVCI